MITKIRSHYIVLLLVLFYYPLSAQSDKKTDSSVQQFYKPQTDNNDEEDSAVWLVKVKEGKADICKQLYKNDIWRQINANWFIVNRKPNIESDSVLFVTIQKANYNWKLSPSLLRLQNRFPLHKITTFLVQVKNQNSFTKSLANNREVAIISSNEKTKTFQVKTTLSFVLQTFRNHQNVVFIDIKNNAPKEEMVINDYDNSVNDIDLFFSRYPAVTGSGLSVSVKENLFDTADIDFKNRYQPTNNISSTITTHATTMATLIGGGGNSFYTAKGIAPASLLSSSDFANLLPDSDSSYVQYGTSVQNHSYGTGIENFYGADAAAFDQALLSNPHLVYVFSSGNSGALTDSDGVYKNITGFANLTGSFKQAKNIIIVGSVDSFYQVPTASSKGPAYDGRIKPELVAYGNDGSSGAAAITSGTALAVQSAYTSLHHDSLPDNTLVKAILLNSADDVFNAGPDYYSGYGNVNTYKAVRDISSGSFFQKNAKQNSLDSFTISVPANISNLKIMLVWNDEPAQANAFTALVNDLDLEVQNKSNNISWLPWVVNASPDSSSLLSPAQRKRDSLNVAEQITLSQPSKGDYTVYVKGYQLTTTSQPYYVVYEMDTANQFQFITPSAVDHFSSGNKAIIRWNHTYNNTTGRLEYSTDKGLRWQLINNNISLADKYYTWQVPDTSAPALMRMTIGNNVYTSDTFDLSKQLSPQVVVNCNDSVLIRWNEIEGIHQYKIFQLGEKYLQEYATVTDTSVIVTNSVSPYIAVAPVFDNGRVGLISYTFNYNTQGVGCYINNFLADLTVDNKAGLSLTLGTISGVDSIQFQQLIKNNWQTINAVQPVTDVNINYTYSSLLNGINTFRAVVWVGGNAIVSNTADILYFLHSDFIAKPNPLRQGQNLSILSSTLIDGTLVIYDLLGRKLWQQEVTNQETIIRTNTLSKGIYFLVIYDDKQRVFTNKLIVE